MRGTALGLAHLTGARSVEELSVPASQQANRARITEATPSFSAQLRSPDGSAGSPALFRVSFETRSAC